MNFYFKKVVLWLTNGKKREVIFEPNKVNVITGVSLSGKTEILHIIDYCFFGSSTKISQSAVNENVEWYGLLFNVNGKNYTIARKSFESNNNLSKDYFFSSEGDLPSLVITNNTENGIKSILESEFSIDSKVSIPYGANFINVGTKISLRYFLMFNTISVNIIENDEGVFFDKQHENRYRDALPRIFDLAVGIETVTNILKKEKKSSLESKLSKLNRKLNSISDKSDTFKKEQESIVKEAKEYLLIDESLDIDSSIDQLTNIVSNLGSEMDVVSENKSENIEQDIYLKQRKITNLRRYLEEYDVYKNNLKTTLDSLKPIDYLAEKDSDIIKTSIFDDITEAFSFEIRQIKEACKDRLPLYKQVHDEIAFLENELISLRESQAILPKTIKSFRNVKEKYFFLGGVKSKMDLYMSSEDSFNNSTLQEIEELESQIQNLYVQDNLEKRDLTIKLIEEIISEYIEYVGDALENYASYKPVFNYKEKSLSLRKPKSTEVENVGSSSNHVFLQLFFSLSMHEVVTQNKSPFIAPFLIIDQPSRPYWGRDNEKKENFKQSDDFKIKQIFKLLNNFIETKTKNSNTFQMIVFEHVPKEYFSDLNNFHLVEEFKDGNKLIPM